MPIFEYKCLKCGNLVEFLETSGSAKGKACPHCGSKNLQKQFSTFAPRIKEGSSKKCFGCTDDSCPHSGR